MCTRQADKLTAIRDVFGEDVAKMFEQQQRSDCSVARR